MRAIIGRRAGARSVLVLLAVAVAALAWTGARPRAQQATKRLVILAGRPSHPPGQHEFHAGALLFQKALAGFPGLRVDVVANGWPTKMVDGARVDDNAALEHADAILIYADGGRGNPAIQGDRLAFLDSLARRGVSLGFAHYGVEVPVGPGADAFMRWIGGYYEDRYSVNPIWRPSFDTLPTHPITRGVQPFGTEDEWYFSIRWTSDPAVKARITPILVATPSDDVRDGPYVSPRGPYAHVMAASGQAETMMWVTERPDGGRGLGFNGGHSHANWGDVNQRRLMLNALVWLTGLDVPAGGVQDSIGPDDLKENLDKK